MIALRDQLFLGKKERNQDNLKDHLLTVLLLEL